MRDITRKGRVVQEQILACIERENSLLSTRQLSQKLGFAWHTVQHYCMELLFLKKIEQLEIAGRHIWIKSSSHLPQISQTDFTTLLEKHIETSLEKEFTQTLEKEFEKEFEKEINNELQTILKNLLDTEIKNLLKKVRETRITAQSAAGGVNK